MCYESIFFTFHFLIVNRLEALFPATVLLRCKNNWNNIVNYKIMNYDLNCSNFETIVHHPDLFGTFQRTRARVHRENRNR